MGKHRKTHTLAPNAGCGVGHAEVLRLRREARRELARGAAIIRWMYLDGLHGSEEK